MTAPVLKLAAARYMPGTRHLAHDHDELQMSVVLRGSVAERVGAHVEHAGALSVVVKDPRVTHADEFGDSGALIARLAVQRTGFGQLVEHPARAASWQWRHGAAAAGPFLRIAIRGVRGETAFAADDTDVADLLAALSARPSAPASGEAPTWLRTAVGEIVDGWRPGLTVRELARTAGVHPVYLARCVRRWFGVSTGELIRHARFRHAAHAVASAGGTVSSIAHELRYSDEPHLCREFAKTVGVTPGRLRRLVDDCERSLAAADAA